MPVSQDRSLVEIFYPLDGLWYWGGVLDGPNAAGEYLVRYEKWGEGYDEWVAQDRVRPRRIPGEGIAGRPGEPVEASTYQGWLPATIVEGPDPSGRYRLNMDGWDSSYDQWLARDKLRTRWTAENSLLGNASAPAQAPPTIGQAAGSGAPSFLSADTASYAAYALVTPAEGAAPQWVACGTVKTQDDGMGLEVHLDLLPVSGRLIIRKG